jgi:hypothetical protein
LLLKFWQRASRRLARRVQSMSVSCFRMIYIFFFPDFFSRGSFAPFIRHKLDCSSVKKMYRIVKATTLARATHRLVQKFIFNLFIVVQNYFCETRDRPKIAAKKLNRRDYMTILLLMENVFPCDYSSIGVFEFLDIRFI